MPCIRIRIQTHWWVQPRFRWPRVQPTTWCRVSFFCVLRFLESFSFLVPVYFVNPSVRTTHPPAPFFCHVLLLILLILRHNQSARSNNRQQPISSQKVFGLFVADRSAKMLGEVTEFLWHGLSSCVSNDCPTDCFIMYTITRIYLERRSKYTKIQWPLGMVRRNLIFHVKWPALWLSTVAFFSRRCG